ncbi:hypothetical protein NIIDMKKI_09890 [Mycobacterium kansasii]|uniref:Uncharacterized protein n=1 Tax=Mycobacterium kansasii TaxID=1768 RepID=A0A7G1I671_MYCKA|nr:hypothetical protein NIIDMKKI_09890 [Mycobacterium kansasii]
MEEGSGNGSDTGAEIGVELHCLAAQREVQRDCADIDWFNDDGAQFRVQGDGQCNRKTVYRYGEADIGVRDVDVDTRSA